MSNPKPSGVDPFSYVRSRCRVCDEFGMLRDDGAKVEHVVMVPGKGWKPVHAAPEVSGEVEKPPPSNGHTDWQVVASELRANLETARALNTELAAKLQTAQAEAALAKYWREQAEGVRVSRWHRTRDARIASGGTVAQATAMANEAHGRIEPEPQ